MQKNKNRIILILCLSLSSLGLLYLCINMKTNNPDSTDDNSLLSNINEEDREESSNEKPIEESTGVNEKIDSDNKRPEIMKTQLHVPQSVQETNYYCVPASLQMVLRYHDIEVSQTRLAEEMNTVPVDGTEYIDLARVANKYIFKNNNVGANDPGYHVQTLNRYDTSKEIAQIFEKRVKADISTNDPVFAAIDVNALYPHLPSGNHIIVITGYTMDAETDTIAYYYFNDPSIVVQDATYGGLKTATNEALINAIVSNIEPAYIW